MKINLKLKKNLIKKFNILSFKFIKIISSKKKIFFFFFKNPKKAGKLIFQILKFSYIFFLKN
jgi:hypothetical protein